jgi:hypothetical protein
VAVYYADATGFDLARITATGGAGRSNGSPGTVFLARAGQLFGELLVDARGVAPSQPTPIHSLGEGASTLVEADRLRDDLAAFAPDSLAGLELNPDTSQSRTFTIVANDANTILTDPADGDLREVAIAGAPYAAPLLLDALRVRGGALLDFRNADRAAVERAGTLRATGEVSIEGSRLVGHAIQAAALALAGSGVLTLPASSAQSVSSLRLDVGSLAVDATSRIDADARGFQGGLSGDNGAQEGRTLGNTTSGGSPRRVGGSYGGLGGVGDQGGLPNAVYGSALDPDQPGSGGGSDCGSGGSGGGLVRITASQIALDGSVSAGGGSNPGASCPGGGSGGGIRIDADSLAGAGAIRADGGAANPSYAGGGGGGRVAVYADDLTGFEPARITAQGGAGRSNGAAGSVAVAPRAGP